MERIWVYSHLIRTWQKLLNITDEAKSTIISMQVITQSTLSQQ